MYKTLFAAVAILAGGISMAATAALAEPSAERQEKLLYLLEQDCGSCHGLTMRGGLGPALLPEALGDKDDGMLADTIIYGRPGTPMPPWESEITPDEALWLVERLRAWSNND